MVTTSNCGRVGVVVSGQPLASGQLSVVRLDLDSERLIRSPNKWQAFDRITDKLPAPNFVVLNNASRTSIVLDESICIPLLTRACSSARSTSTATLTSTSWRASARTDAPSSGSSRISVARKLWWPLENSSDWPPRSDAMANVRLSSRSSRQANLTGFAASGSAHRYCLVACGGTPVAAM